MLLNNFLLPLLLTITIEGILAFALGYRGKVFFAVLVLVNIMTNPVLNYSLVLLYMFNLQQFRPVVLLLLEVLVVFAEWKLFRFALLKDAKALLVLSAVINTGSFLIGLLFLHYDFCLFMIPTQS
jgi:hypothetical protein